MTTFELHLGDCLETLRGMADNSVDSIVTDPPYGLTTNSGGPSEKGKASPQGRSQAGASRGGFMGHKWDSDVPSTEIWAECLRVLKPGGHLLAFAGTRTQHRMAVRIEDAGFEIRDMIAWVYGSGFPKSLNVGKAIDKAAGAEREVLSEGKAVKRMIPGADQNATGSWIKDNGREYVPTTTAPATEAAQQWDGWGTALKPALEPITVARKPLIGTVAENVQAHGTGALNIDGCRVGDFVNTTPSGVDRRNAKLADLGYRPGSYQMGEKAPNTPPGRWPANLIHDGSDEVLASFPDSNGSGPARKLKSGTRAEGDGWGMNSTGGDDAALRDAGNGSAARFFYCAKASRKDRNDGLPSSDQPAVATNATMREREIADWGARNGNHHPTVKPTDLMAYLVRLVTPPGGVVLDPFMGSGSTGKAAMREGCRFIGCELSEEYLAIARARIEHELTKRAQAPAASLQVDLFAA